MSDLDVIKARVEKYLLVRADVTPTFYGGTGFDVIHDIDCGSKGHFTLTETDVFDLLAALKEAEDALVETVPKSWAGLIELLNEAYPEDIFPVLPDEPTRDQGPRILSLVRLLNRERTRAESAERRIAAVEELIIDWSPAAPYRMTRELAAALHPVAEITEHGPDWSDWNFDHHDEGPSCRCGFNGSPEECASSRIA